MAAALAIGASQFAFAADNAFTLECVIHNNKSTVTVQIDLDAMRYTSADSSAPGTNMPIAKVKGGWIYLRDFGVHSPDGSHSTELAERVNRELGKYVFYKNSPYSGRTSYGGTCHTVE